MYAPNILTDLEKQKFDWKVYKYFHIEYEDV